jgi:hypothetical protein
MLVPHSGHHIPVPHGLHDSSQAPRFFQDPGAAVMSVTIQDKIFGKTGFDPCLSESLCNRSQMTALRTLGYKYPSYRILGCSWECAFFPLTGLAG